MMTLGERTSQSGRTLVDPPFPKSVQKVIFLRTYFRSLAKLKAHYGLKLIEL